MDFRNLTFDSDNCYSNGSSTSTSPSGSTGGKPQNFFASSSSGSEGSISPPAPTFGIGGHLSLVTEIDRLLNPQSSQVQTPREQVQQPPPPTSTPSTTNMTNMMHQHQTQQHQALSPQFYQNQILQNQMIQNSMNYGPRNDLLQTLPMGMGAPIVPQRGPNVWDEFNSNGRETELDDLDLLIRQLTLGDRKPAMKPQPSLAETVADPMLLKARFIQLIRESEKGHRKKKRDAKQVCVFCRNNGETEVVYSSHSLKDPEGRVTCPILYVYECPKCKATGHNAHTIKYCPLSNGEAINIRALRTQRTSAGRRRLDIPLTAPPPIPLGLGLPTQGF